MYLTRGFKIISIRGDLEFAAIQKLVDELPSRPRLVLAAQGEHVGTVERNIRYTKEKVRSLRYTLPFTNVPKTMIIYMVFTATSVNPKIDLPTLIVSKDTVYCICFCF